MLTFPRMALVAPLDCGKCLALGQRKPCMYIPITPLKIYDSFSKFQRPWLKKRKKYLQHIFRTQSSIDSLGIMVSGNTTYHRCLPFSPIISIYRGQFKIKVPSTKMCHVGM